MTQRRKRATELSRAPLYHSRLIVTSKTDTDLIVCGACGAKYDRRQWRALPKIGTRSKSAAASAEGSEALRSPLEIIRKCRCETGIAAPDPPPTDPETIVNTCKVCETPYTFASWNGLHALGRKFDFGAYLEHRQCPCGNRLAILLDADGNYLPEHPLDKDGNS